MGTTQITAEPGVPQIIITREFDCPRDLLFRAYTEPDLLVRWLGPAQLTLTVDQLDVRHGGAWRYTHHDADGNDFTFHGLFHGTPSPDRIVQTYEFDREPGRVYLNTLRFDEMGDRSRLHQNTVFQTVEDRDGYVRGGMDRGARESMDNLDRLITELGRQEA